MIGWPNFVTLFKLFQQSIFSKRHRHLAPPVAPCYAQASPNKIFQGRSLKGPGKEDILELTKLADYVYLMYILQVLVVLFVCFRVPWSIYPGRLRSSQSSLRGKRFRLISEQRNTEEGDLRFWPREKWNEGQKVKEGLFNLRHFSRGLWLSFLVLFS